jgi:beta-glucosidase
VMAYFRYRRDNGDSVSRMPVRELRAFKRISVPRHGKKDITLRVPLTELQKWDLASGHWKLYTGNYNVYLGDNSSDEKLVATFNVSPKDKPDGTP